MWLSLVEIFSDLRVNEENVETFRGWIKMLHVSSAVRAPTL